MTQHSRPMREDASAALVPAHRLRAHPRNVRTDLGDLRELAESIRYEGVLVPLMAERRGDHLRILHGHRRWAAAQLAGVTRVPVVIVPEHGDRDAMFLMLAEDKKEAISRPDRRRAVLTLRGEFGCTWTEIAERLGYSVATVRSWASSDEDDLSRMRSRPPKDRGPAAPRPPTAPSIGARRVHDLLARHDAGDVGLGEVVDELRGWLGDWAPPPEARTTRHRGQQGTGRRWRPTGRPAKRCCRAASRPGTFARSTRRRSSSSSAMPVTQRARSRNGSGSANGRSSGTGSSGTPDERAERRVMSTSPLITALLQQLHGQTWRLDALCAQVDHDTWFPEKGGSTAPAKSVCAACPARTPCLEYALDHDERFGVYGGLSERERRRMTRARPGEAVS